MDEMGLDELRWHWGEAYLINHPRLGLWLAERLDTRDTLRAADSNELNDKIRADYLKCPVSRRVSRPELKGGARSAPSRFLPEG